MVKTHVDILGKILRRGPKESRELREAGFAWRKDYDEIAEKANRSEELVTRRKEEARLQKEYDDEKEIITAEEDTKKVSTFRYSDISNFKFL
jgi:hypothetical protein